MTVRILVGPGYSVEETRRQNPGAVVSTSYAGFKRGVRYETQRLAQESVRKKAEAEAKKRLIELQLAEQQRLKDEAERKKAEALARAQAEYVARLERERQEKYDREMRERTRYAQAKVEAERIGKTTYEVLAETPMNYMKAPQVKVPVAPVPVTLPQETIRKAQQYKAPPIMQTQSSKEVIAAFTPKKLTPEEVARVEGRLAYAKAKSEEMVESRPKGVIRDLAALYHEYIVSPSIGTAEIISGIPSEVKKQFVPVKDVKPFVLPKREDVVLGAKRTVAPVVAAAIAVPKLASGTLDYVVEHPTKFIGETLAFTIGAGKFERALKAGKEVRAAEKFAQKIKTADLFKVEPYRPVPVAGISPSGAVRDVLPSTVREVQYGFRQSPKSFYFEQPAIVKSSYFADVKKLPGYLEPEVAPELQAIRERLVKGPAVEITTPYQMPLTEFVPGRARGFVSRMITEQRPARRFDYPHVGEPSVKQTIKVYEPRVSEWQLRFRDVFVKEYPKDLIPYGEGKVFRIPEVVSSYEPVIGERTIIDLKKVGGRFVYEPERRGFSLFGNKRGSAYFGQSVFREEPKAYVKGESSFGVKGGTLKEAREASFGVRPESPKVRLGADLRLVPSVALSPVTGLTLLPALGVSPAVRIAQLGKVEPGIKDRANLRVEPIVASDVFIGVRQDVGVKQKQSVMQDVVLWQDLVQEERLRYPVRLSRSSVKPPKVTTDKPPFPKVPVIPKLGDEEDDKEGMFDVFVKRRGFFSPVRRGVGLSEARKAAFSGLELGAAASAKIVPKGQGLKARGIIPELTDVFRVSKVSPDVIVQKRQFRISSPGEKQEITYKGIAASKRKRLFAR